MLKKVKSAFLITDVSAFAHNYTVLAEDAGVLLRTESCWNKRYRINADVVIFGSKHFESINEIYYPISVMLLKEEENPFPYIEKGVTRFIFNYRNNNELLYALYVEESALVKDSSSEYEEMINSYKIQKYKFGDYDFDFKADRFQYKGKLLYIGSASKKYLAEWLLLGHKDNSKRMFLCNMRKKFGESFLKDVDRFGEYTGGNYE